jgi:hypothetical protein
MKVVKFENGKYAIRRWRFGYEYLHMGLTEHQSRCEWLTAHHLSFCLFDTEHSAVLQFNELNKPRTKPDYGTPISIKPQENK